MSRMRWAVALAVIATLFGPASPGQERRFEVRGSVVDDIQGRPLANIEVYLRTRESGSELYTETDTNGIFSFTRLSPGRYSLRTKSNWFLPVLAGNLSVEPAHPVLTLRLPVQFDLCPPPVLPHYFRRLDPGSDKALAAFSGIVKETGGAPVEGSEVTLYIASLGQVATTHTQRGGSFSFTRLKPDESYRIQVVSKGYFPGEVTRLKVLAGYESIYEDVALESCGPGDCDPALRQIRVLPIRE
jgi:hypothetical protein